MTGELRRAFVEFMSSAAPGAEIVFMQPSEAVFEECAKMNCFYCGRYGNNWRCPPNLPDIDYPKLFSEFDGGAFVGYSYDLDDQRTLDAVRSESSVAVHRALLRAEKWLYDHDKSTAISFGAGSCKLCKGGCGKERCNNPYNSRSPLEAAGVNVLKTAAKFGIDIRFPTTDKLMRVGLVMWQD